MRRALATLVIASGALLATGCGADDAVVVDPPPSRTLDVALTPVAAGLSAPLAIASPPGEERLYVAERVGRVWRIDRGRRDLALDVSDEISEGGEQGLLGLAFHPGFARNGRVYIDYTDPSGATRVHEIAGAPDRARLDRGPRRQLLRVEQPEVNHNGGHLAFGRDGFLYVGLGDGGGGGDPHDNGQDPSTPLGSILRIDVDGREGALPYAIPPDNPFAAGGGAPEVYVYGLRNPWRFALDGPEDDLWIADVGQDTREEVTHVPGDAASGANLGWPLREGTRRNRDGDDAGAAPPTLEYGRDVGCSVTGGVVQRGGELPGIEGRFVVADYCTGRAFAVAADDAPVELIAGDPGLAEVRAFGSDGDGGLYAAARDSVYRLSPSGPAPAPADGP